MNLRKLIICIVLMNIHDVCFLRSESVVTPQERLISFVDGFLISRALYTVAELKIADELVTGPKTAEDIAKVLHLNGDATHRLLRMLAAHGVFTYQNNQFGLNEISELMTTTHRHSMHGFVLHEDQARWQAYGNMSYSLQTGKPAFNEMFGKGYFDYIADNPERAAQFDAGMATFSETENKAVAAGFDYSSYQRIVDVGGGVGGLLTQILDRHVGACGIVYELSHLQQMASDYRDSHGMTDTIEVVAGSFLESVVCGGDLYILKRILHDWNDEICVKILKNCVEVMDDTAKIVVFDCIVPDGNDYDISKDIDIIMMVIFGGKERTTQDFYALFDQAGLQITAIKPIEGTMLCAIEGMKK